MNLPSSMLTRPGWIVSIVLVLSATGPFAGPAVLVAAQAGAESAIQDAILRGNQAQVQAITVRDASIVSDAAVGAYAKQLVQFNQDLLDSGAIALGLDNIEWGPVELSGGSASITTFETWRTSYSDGPTEFSRDRNVYTLSQAPSGDWKIAGNDHPDGRHRPQIPAAEPPPPDAQPAGPGTSRNWAGYAARDGSFTSVSASWTVPKLGLDSAFGADATWVGIGGLRSRDLIQAGTQQTATGTGMVTYLAWIEMLPAASVPVPLTVLPGDTVNVSIDQQDGNNWLFSMANVSSGQTLQRSVQYASTLGSAEWIEEAPFARRRVLPISEFGSITFTGGSAVRDGQTMTIADLGARSIALVDNAGRRLAVPSPLGPDGGSFTVART